ncbi:MAG: DUF2089 domain-containing protein [Thermomicrobiaceae bacterium]|nr:DUF2089 domain-containing protein [Thermomicrobiaceae bacterium]
MVYPAPHACPTCQHDLAIQELACPHCGTTVRGRWLPDPFSRLTPDQRAFLALFVRSRGNLSDVERTLGVSYPTVRAKLEEIIAALGEAPAPSPARPPASRQEVLGRIARGELSVDEGLALLRERPRTEES